MPPLMRAWQRAKCASMIHMAWSRFPPLICKRLVFTFNNTSAPVQAAMPRKTDKSIRNIPRYILEWTFTHIFLQ